MGPAEPGGGQVDGRPVRWPEAVPSVDGGKQDRRGGRRDVVLDGGDVSGAGRRRRRRDGVVVTQRVGVVFERDAHRLPVLDRRRAGDVARGGRDSAADLVRLTVD